MKAEDVIDVINKLTIEIVKLKVERLKIENYLANGGDPADLNKQNGTSKLPVENLPF